MVALVSTIAKQPAVASGSLEVELGLIKNARHRQRRRRFAGAAVALLSASTGLMLGLGGDRPSGSSRSAGVESRSVATTIRAPGAVFAHRPYMGVACHVPNSVVCDRVGLAVWLRRPATVTAKLAGAPLVLNAPHWSYVTRDRHAHTLYVYAGFLEPAGLTTRLRLVPNSKWTNSWLGANAPSPLVQFRIKYRDGAVILTQEHVYLSAGWG